MRITKHSIGSLLLVALVAPSLMGCGRRVVHVDREVEVHTSMPRHVHRDVHVERDVDVHVHTRPRVRRDVDIEIDRDVHVHHRHHRHRH